ncbi:MAG: ThuA domain-containing protein [Bacteroidales bacterium]|nr:ThuA domain-containing protein [Bacteroidales bacterium]MBQ1679841.1 ThuA domain-containing protein [Bacteroidales bacterium]
MKKALLLLLTLALAACGRPAAGPADAPYRETNYAKNGPRFKVLLLYDDSAEEAHVQFDHQAIAFFNKLTVGEGFIVDSTQNLGAFTADQLKEYTAIIALNAAPSREARPLFENYMENGGGWIGFHAAAYNDSRTQWPWFLKFLGGGVFKCNNWPPQPALLELDRKDHPVTRNLPDTYVCPATEFYQWTPEPRENPDIEVLVSLSPRNFPMGLKDIVYGGDFPVVWTNRNYRMIYINMGHGDEQFSDATEQLLFINALQWIVSNDPNGNPLDK